MDRRLTTIVAADLAGYSRLMAADEEGTISRLRAVRNDLIDPAVAEAGGRVIKSMGDGLLIEFPSPVAAVRCVIGVQDEIARRETGAEDARLRFRVGINLGDVVIDGDDILGDGVNVAARLESLAPPGGICIARTVQEQVRGKVGATLTPLGPQMVKNIPDPVDVWRVEVMGVETPAAAKPTERPSIAVLAFDSMSSDPEQEFLADGIVEDVITELSRFRNLLVIARNSTFTYKGTATDVRQIAQDLGVRYVVEGSVRRAGNRIRLTAQLIEAETGAHVWADKWDRVVDDLFAIQDELTTAIVTAVEPELGAHERQIARIRPSDSLTAWELYQRGIAEGLKLSKEGTDAADVFFNRAIEADPGFAAPHAMIARSGWVRIGSGWSDDPAAELPRAIASAKRALELDDKHDLAHSVFGVLLAMSGDPRNGLAAAQEAIALNPNNAHCHYSLSMVGLFQDPGDGDLMVRGAKEALKLSPRDPRATMFHFFRGFGHQVSNGHVPTEASIAGLEEACRYQNAPWFAPMLLSVSLVRNGQKERAEKHLASARERNPGLSLKAYMSSFVFPSWPDWLATDREALETLVEMGLPRE